jgi:hypothetical protein
VISNYRAKQSVTFTHVKKRRYGRSVESSGNSNQTHASHQAKYSVRGNREKIAGRLREKSSNQFYCETFIATFYVGGKKSGK